MRVGASLVAAPLLAGWLIAMSAGAGAAAIPRITLPAGTGPHGVGVRSLFLYDYTRRAPGTRRPRALPVSLWYPTRHGLRGRRPRYMPVAVERAWAQQVGVPAGTFNPVVPAIVDAPPLSRPAPNGVLVLLPGYRSAAALQTNQALELASRGYAVITFDSPGSGLAVAQPRGRVDLGEPASVVNEFLGFSQRLRDVGFVLQNLPRLVPRASRARLGILGHSMGGAVAAAAVFHYPRFAAGLDFDGSPIGDVVDFGLPKPFAFMLSYQHPEDPWLDTFLLRSRAAHPTVTMRVLHFGFTDLALLTPKIAQSAPAVAQTLESEFPAGTEQSVTTGRAAMLRVRKFVDSFFGRHLRRK